MANTGTLVAKLSAVAQADGTVVTAANSGFSSVSIPAGTTFVHRPSAKMADSEGYELTQSGTGQVFGYLDFAAKTVPSFRLPYRCPTSPALTTTILRGYTAADHLTILWGLLHTATNRLQFLEQSPGTLNVTSSSGTPMVPGDDYIIEGLLTTTTMTITVYPRGSATPLFSITGTLTNPVALASVRLGIGTGSAMALMQFSDGFAIGSTDTLPRTDIAVSAPTGSITAPAASSSVQQNSTIDLRGTASSGATAAWSITSYPSTLSAAPPITSPTSLTAASFPAVAFGDYTIRLRLTNSGGTTDYTRTVSVVAASGFGGDLVWTGTAWD